MEQDIINSLITENMKKIFSFCLSRLNNAADAEDLAGDIFVELLRSCKNIREDNNFYGFMWAVADNIYKRYLREKSVREVSFDVYENYTGNIFNMPEDMLINKEEMSFLKRELALLSKEYRETTVLYYIKNKSCSEIAEILNISNEMVKYYLFKARKFMKEGMYMPREFGEKSYNPDIFRMDYWGTGPNDDYWRLFERKLPGNILLAAYYEPLTITELALELGVAAPYLEDEMNILLRYDLIKLSGNGKYQSNIVIFTAEYETEAYNATKNLYAPAAESLYKFIAEKENEIRSIGFWGSQYSKNRLYWSIANLTLLHSYNNMVEKLEDLPLLSNGSHGYVFGYNRDYSGHNISGIDCADTITLVPPMFTTINYAILNNPLSWKHHRYVDIFIKVIENKPVENLEKVSDLIRSGFVISEDEKLTINFPVYTVSQFKKLLDILDPAIFKIKETINKSTDISAKILISHTPKALKDKCKTLIAFSNGMRTMGNIIESMCEQNLLFVPKQTEIVSTYGILEG